MVKWKHNRPRQNANERESETSAGEEDEGETPFRGKTAPKSR